MGATVGQEVVTETYGIIEVTEVDDSMQVHCRSVNDPDQGELVFDMESWQDVLQEAAVCAETPEKCRHCKKASESVDSETESDSEEPTEGQKEQEEEPAMVEEEQISEKKARKKGGE